MFITKLRATADTQVRYRTEDFFFQSLGARSAAGARVTAASAMGLPTVWSCVNYLAKTFAVLALQLFEPPEPGRRRGKRVAKHWLLRLFNRRPNEFQSPYEFAMMLEGHLALRGNAFCQITANGRGEITALLPLHPDRMQMELLPNGSYRYRYRDQNGREIIYLRSEIWHLRGLSNDGLVGLSPVEIAREAIGESLAMQSYAARFFANDAKPGGGWIEVPGEFADKATKQTFRDSWQEMQGGVNRGKVAVLEKGMKFHELGWNNADMQFVEARSKNIPILAGIWGVPPHKVGDLSRSTNNNIEHQSLEYISDTMLPLSKLWTSSQEFFLLGPDSELNLEYDMTPLMLSDSDARAKYFASRTQWGSMTPNEVREREGDDWLPGLDRPLLPLNMVPVNEDGSIPTPQPKLPAPAPDGGNARLSALMHGNAERMARRIASGNGPTAELIAEALAVPRERAAAWLDLHQGLAQPLSEDQITASLVALGA